MAAVLAAVARARRPAWVGPVAVGVAGLGACAVLALDHQNGLGLVPPCPFRLATGLDCPGCGTVRALRALGGGDLLRALDHNLMTVVLLPVLVGVYLVWLWRAVRRGDPRLPQVPAPAAWVVAGTLVVFAVARNLPWPALAWLGSGAG